jgi:hypothetical protein
MNAVPSPVRVDVAPRRVLTGHRLVHQRLADVARRSPSTAHIGRQLPVPGQVADCLSRDAAAKRLSGPGLGGHELDSQPDLIFDLPPGLAEPERTHQVSAEESWCPSNPARTSSNHPSNEPP